MLNPSKKYILSFDYKNIEGAEVKYYINLISPNKGNLHTDDLEFSKTIIASKGAWNTEFFVLQTEELLTEDSEGTDREAQLEIFFYATSDGSTVVTNVYDNVSLKEYTFTREEGYGRMETSRTGEGIYRHTLGCGIRFTGRPGQCNGPKFKHFRIAA